MSDVLTAQKVAFDQQKYGRAMTVDVHSLTWAAIRQEVRKRISDLHLQLERSQPEGETNLIRGQIMAMREILAFGEPAERPQFTEPKLY
jgi:hypothetical protein